MAAVALSALWTSLYTWGGDQTCSNIEGDRTIEIYSMTARKLTNEMLEPKRNSLNFTGPRSAQSNDTTLACQYVRTDDPGLPFSLKLRLMTII